MDAARRAEATQLVLPGGQPGGVLFQGKGIEADLGRFVRLHVDQAQVAGQGRGGLVAVVVLAATTLLFLVLWLTGRGGKDRAETERLRKALRTAETELKLRTGDVVEANKELETLRALAGGKVPPELEKLRTRAEAAEAGLEAERERHKKELELLSKRFGLGSLDPNKTAATPSTQARLEQLPKLEQELAEARRQLAEIEGRHEAALKEQAERLGAEHAAALTALVANGIPGKHPAYGRRLEPERIAALADYVQALKGR